MMANGKLINPLDVFFGTYESKGTWNGKSPQSPKGDLFNGPPISIICQMLWEIPKENEDSNGKLVSMGVPLPLKKKQREPKNVIEMSDTGKFQVIVG